MVVLVATRALLLFGDSLSNAKFTEVYRRLPFHSHARLFSRVQRDNGPLTLASLGFKAEIEKPSGKEKNNIQSMVSVTEVPYNKVKRDSNTGAKLARERTPIVMETAPFAAKSFSELGLPPFLVERLEKEGFEVPTDVQAAAIPTIIENHDVMIQSYTGSGKTLAYLLPILVELGALERDSSKSDRSRKQMDVEAVIIAPSRELGMQIVREVERLLGPVHKKLVQQLVGGANRARQEEALKKNKPAIVVGTPGRIAEISKTGKLHTHNCRFLVLDEVDELLSFSFREDMHRILEHVGRRSGGGARVTVDSSTKQSDRQTIMVSATLPFSVIRAARNWSNNPILVQAKSVIPLESVTPATVNLSGSSANSSPTSTQSAIQSLPPSLKHYYSVSRIQHKVDTLRRCVHALEAKSVIAFMNHTNQLKDTVFKLEARGIKAAELHGDLNKLKRSTILKSFRNGEVRVLVTNELSARGLDVPECDLVVNLELPTDSVHYAHRAGRTGRLGRKGTVVSICEESEVFVMKKLHKQLGVPIPACEFAEGKLVVAGEEEALAAARNK